MPFKNTAGWISGVILEAKVQVYTTKLSDEPRVLNYLEITSKTPVSESRGVDVIGKIIEKAVKKEIRIPRGKLIADPEWMEVKAPYVPGFTSNNTKVLVDIVPDANMAGVVGDVVKSAVAGSPIKHFVGPKKSTELAQPYVILKATGITADQITPGHAFQVFEWDGGEKLDPDEPLKRRVKRDIADRYEVKIRIKGGGTTAVQMNVWITWADLTLEANTPKIQPSSDDRYIHTLNAKIDFKYTCNPKTMFDATQDIPNLNLLPDPPAPGGNHPWPPNKPLADGALIRYDATRQVRAILNSSDQVLLKILKDKGFADIPNFPGDIAEGNDDPNMGGEIMPYQGNEGIQGTMKDVDYPSFSLEHAFGLLDSTFSVHAQFRQYARVQIAGKWFRCSDFNLSDLKFKFKKMSGKWSDDGSTFGTGNGPFPSP